LTLQPGARLGPYEIVSAVGAGGMGEVYKARDTRLDRIVAIKVLPEVLAGDPQFRERFDREARAISQLDHPHICALYDVGEQDGTAFLVMQYLEGETLADRLAKGALPLEQALKAAIEIASALEKAHRAGITHRDLKPGNVMLTRSGAKLLDFGLAKTRAPVSVSGTMAPTVAPNLTAQGAILGTFQYMAPEQLEGQDADARTDIFAFGALLYETLTGRKAFDGKSQASLIGAIMHTDPPPMSALQPLAPTALDRLVRVCLAKDPNERWQSVGDVRRELQWIADGGSQTPAGMPVVARRRTREYVAWALATTLATVLTIGVALLYWRAPREADAIARFTVPTPVGAVRPVQDGFAVAPDGQILAFTARGIDGVSRMFIRRLDASEAKPLAGTDRATLPFWAPDSRSVGFAKEGGLYRLDLDGSAPRRLCDVPGNAFGGGSWGSRGVIVFASEGAGLLRVPDTGGIATPVTTLDPGAQEANHIGPWFLPDGRHVLFLAARTAQAVNQSSSQRIGIIWVTSIDDPARTRIVESDGAAAYAAGWLLWTTDKLPRSLVAQPFDPKRLTLSGAPQRVRDGLTNASLTRPNPGFGISSNGVLVVDRPPPILHQLVWMDRSGRTMGTVGPTATIIEFALAPDERRVVATVRDRDSLKRDLWLLDAGREDGTRLTYIEQGGNTMRPLWARDGRHIYFTATGGKPLRTLTLGATTETEFESHGPLFHFEDVTRDGHHVIFKTLTPSSPEIGIQRVDNPDERRALVKSQFRVGQARVSPDSRWLAFTVELPSGTQIVAQPFARAGEQIPVSPKGGIGAVWRDDSRELYYEGPEGLMSAQMSEHGGALEASTPQKLFSLRTQGYVANQPHNVEVAGHGQKFLVNTIVGDSDNVPLEVTLNWTTGLKH
jgi:predicted Ser/Thr protein kinase